MNANPPSMAAEWDARVNRGLDRLPDRPRSAIRWMLVPERRWVRFIMGPLLILGGLLSILPILGLWMLPLGFALLAEDVPVIKGKLEQAARFCERMWKRFRGRQ